MENALAVFLCLRVGEVYQRLLKDVPPSGDGQVIVDTLMEVYTSWVDGAIPNYNSDLYCQPGDCLAVCCRGGESAGWSFRIHEKKLWNAVASKGFRGAGIEKARLRLDLTKP